MVEYVVRVVVAPEAASAWEDWMRAEHIPHVLATGCFRGYAMTREIDPTPAEPTFEVRYEVADEATLTRYLKDHAPALRTAAEVAFGGRFRASRSVRVRC